MTLADIFHGFYSNLLLSAVGFTHLKMDQIYSCFIAGGSTSSRFPTKFQRNKASEEDRN